MSRNSLYRIKRKLPIFVDELVSPLVDPRDALVITGFWRSGTTWIERLTASFLKAKTIFEPLEIDVRQHYGLGEESYFPSRSVTYLKAHMPFIEDVIPENTQLYCLFNDALRGTVPGKRVRINRKSVWDSLRTRVVVKHVRGQLAIYGLYKTFSTPILHIYRDPRAVIASIIRKDWGGEWMHQLSLRSQLLEPQDGRISFFEKWSDEIEYFDQRPWWERVVMYWGLTETYVRSCASRYKFPIYLLNYEDAVKGGIPLLFSVLSQLGLSVLENPTDNRWATLSSPTTDKDRLEISDDLRLFGWKQDLPMEMAARTKQIVEHFDFPFSFE